MGDEKGQIMAFRIVFSQWIDPDILPIPSWSRPWLYPQFDIYEEARHLFLVNVHVRNDPAEPRYRDRKEEFKLALLQYSVRRIEDALRNESFLSNPPRGFQEIYIGVDDLPFIDKLLEEKNCTYQMKEGRKLFCSAISLDDLHKGYSLPNRAITSRAICLACDLPGTDYLCSNLSHPAVMSRQGLGLAPRRFAAGALCERGEPGAEQDPAQCRPDGHRCWERIVELESEAPEIPSSPLALHEAFGYLDTVWRLAFGRKHALLRLTTMADIAQLSQPCKTRSDFESMMSALAAVLKAMDIPEDLFPGGVSHIQKDRSLDRIEVCLKNNLGDEYDAPCERAISALRAVNAVRYSQQHANQDDLSRAFARLGIPYPISSWSDVWGSICSKTIEALGVIREKVRNFSLGSAGS
jgi:hypothetical protein